MSKSLYSVTGLVRYIKAAFDTDSNLQSILVKGEISNFTNHRSGHWYFSLKDQKAKISCVMFSSYASRSPMLLKEGMKVIVTASVSMYEASGSTQLYVTNVQLDGIGDLYLQLEAVKEKMRLEGCFDPARKKPLPAYPMKIGVITAKTGAAIQDILTTIARRWPVCDLQIYPCLVQGSAAADHIIENLAKADQDHLDVILVARGGGAIEDLWCFNEERVARAILAMTTVVVTGIGHESDTTLADYVSDARAATPTASAELITPDYQDVKQVLAEMKKQMKTLMKHLLQQNRQALLHMEQHRYVRDPLSYIQKEQMTLAMHVNQLGVMEHRLSQQRHQLVELRHALALASERSAIGNHTLLIKQKDRLCHAIKQYESKALQQFQQNLSLLDAFSPLKILQRGYAIAYQDEKIIRSVQEISLNTSLRVQFSDGSIITNIIDKEEYHER